ncbi:MAG: DUF2829 domain-containing protein [Selenomonadaceae bacterium]|nr:DUF2829 domain-containing protein [Selenomonadaceae bacterium]
MDFIESLMKEIVEEVSKGIPEDVLEDLKELSKLQTEVQKCLVKHQIIDHRTITRINELTRQHFHAAEENVKANEKQHETFDFGEAIRRVKKGTHVARKGWNGKGQYIMLALNIDYTNLDGKYFHAHHSDIGSKAIALVGTRGKQIGWLASQADMLADDWYELKGD